MMTTRNHTRYLITLALLGLTGCTVVLGHLWIRPMLIIPNSYAATSFAPAVNDSSSLETLVRIFPALAAYAGFAAPTRGVNGRKVTGLEPTVARHASATATLPPSGSQPIDTSWRATGDLNMARIFHTATLLQNGKVLVVGGKDGNDKPLNTAELYDPTTGTWSPTSSNL